MTPNPTDTIVALATPLGRSAIALLRLSGARALPLLREFVPSDQDWIPRRVYLGSFKSSQGELLDQVVVCWFQEPHSYTGEDLCEISCHGSLAIVEALLEELLSAGARLAEPGEFTLRAFLNGKIDLLQAEAVRDLVESNTRYQAQLAAQQLEGRLSSHLGPLRQELIRICSHLETSLEFVEDEVTPDTREELCQALKGVEEELRELARSFQFGRLVREGVQIAICGRPNVGKSSVFNALLRDERVIVTPRPGTTRDAVGEVCEIGGFQARLVDTAGIRESQDEIERLGVERSRREIERSDLLLWVLDGSECWGWEDEEVWRAIADRPAVVAYNKADLSPRLVLPPEVLERSRPGTWISAREGRGLEELRERLAERIGGDWESYLDREGGLLTNLRQKKCVESCAAWLEKAGRQYGEGVSEEFVLYDLQKALDSLGELTGEITLDELLENIFSSFCIGK